MKLLLKTQKEQMLKNGKATAEHDYNSGEPEPVFRPVVKFFTPDASCTWLLTELDPDTPDIAFGLCDLGMQSPELGSVLISEIEALRGCLGLPVERDMYFKADKTIGEYAEEAWSLRYITA